ncbi:MAG: PAS domain S-box protein [Synergistales bacterium]|nr:PAS domain S-box protein [Synergistales bacterium]
MSGVPSSLGTYYRRLAEQLPDALCLHTAAGRILFCNQAGLQLLGIPQADVGRIDFFALFASGSQRYRDALAAAGQEDRNTLDAALLRRDGAEVPVVLNAQFLDEEESLVQCLMKDRSPRLRQEERLRLEWAISMVDQATDALVHTDCSHRIVYMNRAAEDLFGFAFSEIRGRTPDIFNAEPEARRLQQRIGATLRKGTPYTGDHLNRRKDGALFVCRIRISPLRDSEGHVVGYVESRQDVTEEKEIQEKLGKALEEARLAQRRAEAANQAKNRFFSSMSHEIRTPMNGVMGMLQLLHSTELTDEQSEWVDVALQSAERMTNLLSRLLDLARAESGLVQLKVQPLSLRWVIECIEGLFTVKAKQKGLGFHCSCEDSVPEQVVGDETRVTQVLTILVENAFAFTDQGRIDVHLGGGLGENEEGDPLFQARLTVQDTGVGMCREPLCGTAERESDWLTDHRHGPGMGLPMVRRLLELMSGTIQFEGVPGGGTAVQVTIPFLLSEGEASTEGGAEERCSPNEGLSVLLVEDDSVNRLVLCRILERSGYKVTEAKDGEQALEILCGTSFDCILMDIRMPRMNGPETVSVIRNSEAFRHVSTVPVIAVTAYAQSGDRERFLEEGMDAYLTKPVHREELLHTLEQLCSPG